LTPANSRVAYFAHKEKHLMLTRSHI
jgi:hypothetical protein